LCGTVCPPRPLATREADEPGSEAAMNALTVFTGVVWVFLVIGVLYVVGMIVEHFIEEILL
jgi:hypothetical protein